MSTFHPIDHFFFLIEIFLLFLISFFLSLSSSFFFDIAIISDSNVNGMMNELLKEKYLTLLFLFLACFFQLESRTRIKDDERERKKDNEKERGG